MAEERVSAEVSESGPAFSLPHLFLRQSEVPAFFSAAHRAHVRHCPFFFFFEWLHGRRVVRLFSRDREVGPSELF